MQLDLDDDETRALLKVLMDAIEADGYPLSLRVRVLKDILAKFGDRRTVAGGDAAAGAAIPRPHLRPGHLRECTNRRAGANTNGGERGQKSARIGLISEKRIEMSGRARLPAGAPLKASQRGRWRAAPSKVSVNPAWRPGDKVRWRDRIGVFSRDLGDGEHGEVQIAGRTWRVRLAAGFG